MSGPTNQLSQLVPVLLAKTLGRKVKWEALGDGGIFADLGQYKIIVRDNGIFDHEISLLDADLRLLEAAKDPAALIKQLYEVGRRNALGVDEALKRVKSVLDSL